MPTVLNKYFSELKITSCFGRYGFGCSCSDRFYSDCFCSGRFYSGHFCSDYSCSDCCSYPSKITPLSQILSVKRGEIYYTPNNSFAFLNVKFKMFSVVVCLSSAIFSAVR